MSANSNFLDVSTRFHRPDFPQQTPRVRSLTLLERLVTESLRVGEASYRC